MANQLEFLLNLRRVTIVNRFYIFSELQAIQYLVRVGAKFCTTYIVAT